MWGGTVKLWVLRRAFQKCYLTISPCLPCHLNCTTHLHQGFWKLWRAAYITTICHPPYLIVFSLINSYSISGFKHIFWSIIVCVAMGCAAIFLYSNTIDFMNATVVTTVDTMTVPLSEVFFPSVVVCNINQVIRLTN